jgi:60 kDa SS-A/Ro ribonucleoprotein
MGRPTTYSSLLNKDPANNAGSATNIISWQDRLDRFLILGADGGTYYASTTAHMKQGIAAVTQALALGGEQAVAQIVGVMVSGRLPKMETGIFALAVAINSKTPKIRAAAISAIPTACKIPTHLFSLLTEIKAQGGKIQGRAMSCALARWYTDKEPSTLAYHLIKYRQRNGWKHGDVLRLAHPKGYNSGGEGKAGQLGDLFAWETGKPIVGRGEHLSMIIGYLSLLQESATETDAINLIRDLRFPREGIPDKFLKSPAVWRTLAVNSPMTALFRTLNRMTAVGAFDGPAGLETVDVVTRKLTDAQAIRGAKVHPINVLSALRTYGSGRGVKGSLVWTPNTAINAALDKAFVASFDAQPAMGLRVAIGIDISGSMFSGEIAKIPGLVPAEAAWALAYQMVKTESEASVWCFNSMIYETTETVKGAPSYAALIKKVRVEYWDGGNTNCGALINKALYDHRKVDVFVVITDNEHNHGVDPMTALRRYRAETGIDAKLVVIALTATEYSIGATTDAGALNIVGFDPVAPTIIRSFCLGDKKASGVEEEDSDGDE